LITLFNLKNVSIQIPSLCSPPFEKEEEYSEGAMRIYLIKSPLTPLFQRGGLNNIQAINHPSLAIIVDNNDIKSKVFLEMKKIVLNIFHNEPAT